MYKFTDEEGFLAVKLARERIESHLRREEIRLPALPEVFHKKMGVFVTLNTYPQKELRGCIGFPEPVKPLIDALLDSAISAARRDPRFIPVSIEEMDNITVEVTILTPPQKIEYASALELPRRIKIGQDGLIAEEGPFRGLLLPQVPIEWKWDEETFLDQTCVKAGIPPKDWRLGLVTFYKFSGEIFSEVTPRGEIKRVDISEGE